MKIFISITFCWLLLVGSGYSSEKLKVKIVDRQNSETSYSYYVPQQAYSNSNANVSCYGSGGNVNCSGSEHTSASAVGAHTYGYNVRGATLALQLPDSRIAIVNCESKYSPKFDNINRRSCRFPLVNDIEVEFHGDKAKLEWVVSLDGKKLESETYKVVAVVGTATTQPSTPSPVNASTGQTSKPENTQSTNLADVMTWFDEPAPGPSTEIRDIVITARAYDGVLNILRKLRDSDTAVKSGFSVLDADYHPPSFRLGATLSANQRVDVFYWDDETLVDTTLVMRLRVTRKVYDNVMNAVGHLRTGTFAK